MQQYSTLIFIALLVAAFYFLILRPQRKRQQALQRTMTALTPGSRVMLGSGVFGTVVSVGPRQVVLEVSPGAELTVLKQAITKVVTEEDEDRLEDEDVLEEEATSSDDRIEMQSERPLEGPTTANGDEPAVEPDSPSIPRDSKPPTAD
jgi:preprotein translocase subunit YajC